MDDKLDEEEAGDGVVAQVNLNNFPAAEKRGVQLEKENFSDSKVRDCRVESAHIKNLKSEMQRWRGKATLPLLGIQTMLLFFNWYLYYF